MVMYGFEAVNGEVYCIGDDEQQVGKVFGPHYKYDDSSF